MFSIRSDASIFSKLISRLSILWVLGAGLALPAAAQVTYTGTTANQNFGSVAIGSPATASFSFSVKAGTTVGSIAVVTQGAPNLDFTQATGTTCTATTYGSATNCVVDVAFTPKFAGVRKGAVVFYSGANNTGTQLANVPIYGVGTGPQIAYGPGVATAIAPTADSEQISDPTGVAVDGAGDVFIGIWDQNRVVEVPAGGGAATVIAPTANGTAIYNNHGVAVDGGGDLFIADLGNNRVVEVPAGGGAAIAIDPTVNGEGLKEPTAVAIDGVGDLFIADTYNNRVLEIPAGGGAPILINPTVNGKTLNLPYRLAFDAAGDLFIADPGNNRVVEVPAGGGAATAIDPTVGGKGLNQPTGVAVDGADNLFIVDTVNYRLVEVPAGGGAPTAIDPVVNGLALAQPWDLAIDGAGDLFIADFINNRIVKIQRSQPPTVNFATATPVGSVDTTDGTQTVQIQNIGNEALAITGLSYPPDFPEASGDSSACTGTTSLSSGQLCDLPIEFAPENAGSPLNEDVTLTDNALNVSGAQQSIAVTGTGATNAATHFTVTTTASVVAGSPFTITISALNSFGNAATTYNGTVSFTSSDPLFVNPGMLTLTSGVGQKTVTLKTAGTQTISATDTTTSTLTGAGSFMVASAVAVGVQVSNVQTVAYVDVAFPFTVTAFDAYGNATVAQVQFSSTDPGATLPGTQTLPPGPRVFSAALATSGSQTITVTDTANSSINATSGPITVLMPYLVVTTAADDAGVTGNCTLQTSATTGTDAACSLRDALLDANALGAGIIGFDSTTFATPQTITLGSAGTLTIPNHTSINGPTTGAGATLTNLLTVNGAGQHRIFTVGPGVTQASLSNLNISNGGSAGVNGGGINNQGTLTVTDSTFSGNTANGAMGGAIYNNGVITVNGSTFVGNTAHTGYGFGGAVANGGTLTVNNSTFTGNQSGCGAALFNAATATMTLTSDTISGNAGGCAGGINNAGTLSLANTIVSGNAANPDLVGSFANNGGNVVGVSGIKLAPLGNYGGPTQTMVPLPGSPAICGGQGYDQSGFSPGPDQRGFPLNQLCVGDPPTGSGPLWIVDSGSVQTAYAIALATEPPATAATGQALWPSPVVGLTESGVAAPVPTSTVTMTDSAGLLSGTTTANFSSGSATFGNLMVTAPANGDLLTATLPVGRAEILTAQSSPIQVSAPAADTLYIPAPGSVLQGPEVTFAWTPSSGATSYSLWIGSSGAGSNNIYDSGAHSVTSFKVANLPTNGEKLYVRLNTITGKTAIYSAYTYTATTQAQMMSPQPGTSLGGTTVTFTWSAANGATGYSLWIGSTGAGSSDVYMSHETTGTSATAMNLPGNGETLYARLYTTYGNVTVYHDYMFKAQ